MKRKTTILIFILCSLLVVLYYFGPKTTPWRPSFEMLTYDKTPEEVQQFFIERDKSHKLKPDNQTQIIWAKGVSERAKNVVLYLHGFGASYKEGDPVHRTVAAELGAHVVLPRLAYHGIDTTDALLYYNINYAWEDIKQIAAMASLLGDSLIVVGCSTGATWGLLLAAQYPELVDKLVLISPNLRLKDPNAWLLNNPWGVPIAQKVIGGNLVNYPDQPKQIQQYWYCSYRIEAVAQLQELLENAVNPTILKDVKCPTLSLVYYKNEQEKDNMVDVGAAETLLLGLGAVEKSFVKLPTVGDHVMASSLKSKDIDAVQNAIISFLK